LIIKKYPFPGALSSVLHDSPHKNYVIKGPYGMGLGLNPESEGLHIAFVGGTGILPFLDLFDYLLKKAIITVAKGKG
jgi:NAD(P)H-flavin reductase